MVHWRRDCGRSSSVWPSNLACIQGTSTGWELEGGRIQLRIVRRRSSGPAPPFNISRRSPGSGGRAGGWATNRILVSVYGSARPSAIEEVLLRSGPAVSRERRREELRSARRDNSYRVGRAFICIILIVLILLVSFYPPVIIITQRRLSLALNPIDVRANQFHFEEKSRPSERTRARTGLMAMPLHQHSEPEGRFSGPTRVRASERESAHWSETA